MYPCDWWITQLQQSFTWLVGYCWLIGFVAKATQETKKSKPTKPASLQKQNDQKKQTHPISLSTMDFWPTGISLSKSTGDTCAICAIGFTIAWHLLGTVERTPKEKWSKKNTQTTKYEYESECENKYGKWMIYGRKGAGFKTSTLV